MGIAHKTLVSVMHIGGYYILPDYPFENSLDEIEYDKYDEHKVEQYCEDILSDLQKLIDANKEFQLTEKWLIDQGIAHQVFTFVSNDKQAIVFYKYNDSCIVLATDDITSEFCGCSESFDNYNDAYASYKEYLVEWYGGV